MLSRILVSLGLLLTIGISAPAWAAKVVKVKGRKVLVDLQETDATRGEYYYTINKRGKRTGILKISKVRRGKAIAILGKGKARPGYKLKLRRAKKGDRRTRQAKRKPKPTDRPSSEAFWGLLLGGNSSSLAVDLGTTGEVDLSGSGFSAKGLLDYAVFEQLWFRGLFGMESINASGETNSTCTGDGNECEVEITYLTFDLCGRYLFSLSSVRPWVGGCFDLYFPMSKDSTALEDSSITNTSVMAAALGFDFFATNEFAIPLSIEYGLFPSSDQVKADMLAFRLGFAVAF